MDDINDVSVAQSLLNINATTVEQFEADRRGFLKGGAMFAAALGIWTPELAFASRGATAGREISLHNAHTGEKFKGEYWYRGRYRSDAFREIKSLMRDFRTGEIFPIDPRLMDILFVLQHRLDNTNYFNIFSGYRSEKTNARLRRLTKGVARNSLHMQGQAADLSLPGTRLSYLRKASLKLRSGGVGYYPTSSFIHIDTGRVRSW